ncbi:12051_t:CDS:10, partial [Entrophospora sp. SA101]
DCSTPVPRRIKRKISESGSDNNESEEFNFNRACKKVSQPVTTKKKSSEEHEKLELIGEDSFNEGCPPDGYDNVNYTIPCRTLDNFIIFDVNNKNRIASIEEIDDLGKELHAAGIVKAIYVDEDDEELIEDELSEELRLPDQQFRTTTIFHFQIEQLENSKSEIWIRTQFAFYKLLKPAEEYLRTFEPIYKKIRAANLTIETLASNSEITYEKFIKSIKESASSSPSPSSSSSQIGNELIKIKLTEKDIINNIDYIAEEIQAWISEQSEFGILECPLLDTLFQILSNGTYTRTKKVGMTNADNIRTKRNITIKNPNTAVLTNTNQTCVTPFIQNLTKGLFKRKLITIKQVEDAADVTSDDEIECDNIPIVMIKPITHCIKWDFGDVVYVRNGESDEPQFVKVIYMYEDSKKNKMFHSRFFNHGKETILDELAGDREIFLLDTCVDGKLDTILGKAFVEYLEVCKDESFIFESNQYHFYRYWYDKEYAVFEDVRLHEDPNMKFIYCDDNEECHSCESHLTKEHSVYPKQLSPDKSFDKGFIYKDYEYHQYDFIYIIPEEKDLPYVIGQIIEIIEDTASVQVTIDNIFSTGRNANSKSSQKNNTTKVLSNDIKLMVHILGRVDDLSSSSSKPKFKSPEEATYKDIVQYPMIKKDSRHLYYTNKKLFISDINNLEGVCWVQHLDTIEDLDKYKEENDSFYVEKISKINSPKNSDLLKLEPECFSTCSICKDKREKHKHKLENFFECINSQKRKLRAMDIFSGCGGITIGMDMTGIVNTKWAIEFAPSAALTFKNNNPDAIVYNQCANLLLERTIAEHVRNERPEEIYDFLKQKVPSMPRPGEVDFIYCGPPCQGFSGVNRYQKADDIKNSLVATALSYVDFYRPDYFLLENVRGMLSFRLGGEQDGIKIKGGIKMGVIKFILRSLTALGFGVQQAGNHGIPQSRRRLFIWGAKRDCYLPDFPQISTCFGKQGSINILLPNGKSFTYNKRTNGHAPLPPITVGDAITDLPKFEFVNPKFIYKEDDDDQVARPFKQIAVPEKGWVGDMKTKYVFEPVSEYQRLCRKDSEFLYNHVTRAFNPLTVERIVRIPMFPGADHSNLPEKLKPWCLSDPNSAASRHNGWKGECARAQGFPDQFIFYSDRDDTKDMHRQIGNAVPPPLAFALGKCLLESVFKKSELNQCNIY